MRFVLVDRITELEAGKRALGYRDLSSDSDYYRDHMPSFPVEPGVLVLESMAQLGGRLVQHSVERASGRLVLPMLAMVNGAEFRRPVRPPCRLEMAAEILSLRSAGARVSAMAHVGGTPVASATITYVLVGLDNDAMGMGVDSLASIREWGERTWSDMTDPAARSGERPADESRG